VSPVQNLTQVVRGVDNNEAGDLKDLQQEKEVAEEAWGHHQFYCMTWREMVNGMTKQKKNEM
jgi:hypothetical protein